MKISNYYKKLGNEVVLETTYDNIESFDKVYISKVFTDTPIPEDITSLSWVEYGGTGFFFDKSPDLRYEIEHVFPDYHLYDDFINDLIANGAKASEFKEYTDYSIGFLTRGCFRKCGFCVNQKYDRVFPHSPLKEFYDPTRKKICLLDDNFLGQPNWRNYLEELIATGKPFKFKQGLDERLLTSEKCKLLFNCRYDGAITFAFDDVEDISIIIRKLNLIREYTSQEIKFYVLCGFDSENKYDLNFWRQDLINIFIRLDVLGRYHALPYIMRFKNYEKSPYKGIYITIARWCNQPGFFRNLTLNEFIDLTIEKGEKATARYRDELFKDYPDIVSKCFNRKYWK